jgi:hydrogenase expression/formation protein HypD
VKGRIEDYRDPRLTDQLLGDIREVASRIASDTVSLMEVCGTHTMAIARYGIRSLLPKKLKLLSGPGCPVCVTPAGYVDAAISLSENPDVVIVTFGDLMRVPGSQSNLAAAKAAGGDVRVAYSPTYALELAQRYPRRKIVFLAIGFETTSPSVAWTMLQAKEDRLRNLSFLPACKLIPPALNALASSENVKIDGLICPGHVSAIIGTAPYDQLARQYGIPCVVSGFEPVDVLLAVLLLCRQMAAGEAKVELEYSRSVRKEGNPKALKLLDEVFTPADSPWRGLGTIPASGLEIKTHMSDHDAKAVFGIDIPPGKDDPGCRCGDVLRGLISPPECPLFRTRCSPLTPVGACMVSSEGACAAFYKYYQLEQQKGT